MSAFLSVDSTARGFTVYDFTDRNGEPCTLQDSSIATEPAIWLGCEENAEPHHVTGDALSPRMHLTQEQVRELIPLLQHFADTGQLPSPRVFASFHAAKSEG